MRHSTSKINSIVWLAVLIVKIYQIVKVDSILLIQMAIIETRDYRKTCTQSRVCRFFYGRTYDFKLGSHK